MSAEQEARDMLDRMCIQDAQSFTAGDVVELANLIRRCSDFKIAIRSILTGENYGWIDGEYFDCIEDEYAKRLDAYLKRNK